MHKNPFKALENSSLSAKTYPMAQFRAKHFHGFSFPRQCESSKKYLQLHSPALVQPSSTLQLCKYLRKVFRFLLRSGDHVRLQKNTGHLIMCKKIVRPLNISGSCQRTRYFSVFYLRLCYILRISRGNNFWYQQFSRFFSGFSTSLLTSVTG